MKNDSEFKNFIFEMKKIKEESKKFVWWKKEQIERKEHLKNDINKGERPWIIEEEAGLFLYKYVIKNNIKNILELGTSIGYSTLWLAAAAEENKKRNSKNWNIDTIEKSKHKIIYAEKNFEKFLFKKNIKIFNMMINDFLNNLLEKKFKNKKYDLIFLDADRGHYHEYFPILKKYLQKNGVMIADNANNMKDRMLPFLKILKENNLKYKIKNIGSGILIARNK